MSEPDQRVVIVGGGLAAVRTAQSLRDLGHTGAVTMLSAEGVAPYDRPPLSKTHLLAGAAAAPVQLLPGTTTADLAIDLRLSCRVTAIDAGAKTVLIEDGETMAYDSLVIATGADARPLPGLSDLEHAHHLRSATDADGLAAALRPERDVVIVGGGFIGLEVAAAARQHGCRTTVVEAAALPLEVPLGPDLAAWLVGWHTRQGTEFMCGAQVHTATPSADGIRLVLSDGTTLNAHTVVVGIGVQRDLTWLSEAGLDTHVGLVCDVRGRTNLEHIYGAGDVACRHEGDRCSPVEHWTAAAESAYVVARTVLGLAPEQTESDDYFWSHQGPLRLMAVGHRTADALLTIVAGSLDADKFVAQWQVGDRVVGAVAVNSPRDFLRSRQAMALQTV